MPGDYEQLKRTIEDGVRAAEELQKLLAEQKREQRPKLRLIRGGLIGGAIWAGVEWLRNYKIGVALATTAVAVAGTVIAEHPGSPGADPPPRPAVVTPKTPVSPKPPSVTPAPRRTSPPRTLNAPLPKAAPKKPTTSQLPTAPNLGATKTPKPQPKQTPRKTLLPTITPTVISTVATVAPATLCTGIGVLGLCILGN